MQLVFRCPRCSHPQRADDVEKSPVVVCAGCGWDRPIAPTDIDAGRPTRCLVCGCNDLWRQKDFPQYLGLLMVGLGILLSTIAWAWMEPAIAIGILMGFALLDMVLFMVMPDVLVCYRCASRHRHASPLEDHPKFNLEVHERYRQEAIRLDEAEKAAAKK
jgi:hypothetical protein